MKIILVLNSLFNIKYANHRLKFISHFEIYWDNNLQNLLVLDIKTHNNRGTNILKCSLVYSTETPEH